MGKRTARARGARRRGAPRSRADVKLATRVALIDAALAEFAAHGLDAPSLDAICARAGYTRGAFYVHFRDRADLMVAVVEHALGVFIDAVIASGDEAHDLERTVVRFADAVTRALTPSAAAAGPVLPLPPTVPFARILEGVTRNPRLRGGFLTLLGGAVARVGEIGARGQRAGAVRADVDPAQLGVLLAIVALGALVAVDVGLALDPPALRATVLKLLAAPRAARG
jgi:AcrR family transcriptional regulator